MNGSYINGFSKADFNFGRKCWGIDDLQYDIAQGKAAGDSDAFSATAYSPSDLTAYALPGGAALVAFTVSVTEVETATTAGDTVTHTTTKSDPASFLAPVGTFNTVTYPELCEMAAIDPAKGAGVKPVPRVVGTYCGYLQGSGS